MAEGSGKVREISLGEDFGDVAVTVKGIRVEVRANGRVDVYTNGPAQVHHIAKSHAKTKAEPQVGNIERGGEHKGEIYGGIYPADNKPIWFLTAPDSMNHFKAASWATEHGGALPTRKQGDYLTTLKISGGAFTELFNRGNSFPGGYVWLAEPLTPLDMDDAWCQRLSDGHQSDNRRFYELPVLCVRRASP
jgi:hypothetical protein